MDIPVDCPVKHICDFKINSIDTTSGSDCKQKYFNAQFSSSPELTRLEFGDGIQIQNSWNSVKHTYNDTGLFQACLYASDSFSCHDTMCIWVEVTCLPNSGLNHQLLNNTKVYPLPFLNELNIEAEYSGEICIYDLSLKCVFRYGIMEGVNRINLEDLDKGIYILNISSDNGSQYLKIYKQ
jgi:hypothetical protein